MKFKDCHSLALATVLMALSLGLSGCGEIIVFGHTVREGKHSSGDETKTPDAQSPQPVAPADSPTSPTSQAQPSEKQSAKPATTSALQKVKLMSVVLSPQAAVQIKDDPKFNADDLQSSINAELRSRKVLEEAGAVAPVAASGEVTIDNYAFYPTSNVILFGKTYHAGTISGVLRIRDADGNELSQQRIDANVRVAIPEEGKVANPLEPLYREFAQQLGDVLTGTPVKSTIGTGSERGRMED